MFCPNCGKDCGDGKFCSECGTQLQQSAKTDAQQMEWKVGMACPHCGGTKLEGNCCAFCGAQLMLEEYSKQAMDLNDYFDLYNPDRTKAIKALREHTGIGLIEAKKLIDQVFDKRLGQTNNNDLSTAWNNLKTAIKNSWS